MHRSRVAHGFADRWSGCDHRCELKAARELIEKLNDDSRAEELAEPQAAIEAG